MRHSTEGMIQLTVLYYVEMRKHEGSLIKRGRRGHSYCGVTGEILGPSQDELLRKHLPRMFLLRKPT